MASNRQRIAKGEGRRAKATQRPAKSDQRPANSDQPTANSEQRTAALERLDVLRAQLCDQADQPPSLVVGRLVRFAEGAQLVFVLIRGDREAVLVLDR